MFDVDYGFTKLWWSPAPPTDLLVAQHRNMFRHFIQVIAWNQALRTWQVLSQFSQLRALAWCIPAQQLVCHSTGPDWGTLALLDPYEGSLASSSLLVYPPDDPIISPCGDSIIVGVNEQDLAVCRLPGLTIAWYLAHPGMQLAVPDSSDRSWIAWAPTGQCLAMVGCRAGALVSMAAVSRLRICAALDGTELASFNSWPKCWPGLITLQTQEICLTWAPSGDCIAVHHYRLTDEIVTPLRSVILVDCTGSHCVLEGAHIWLAASATWSSCGRYLMVDSKTKAGVVKCAVWDTAAKVQIWCWDGTAPTALAWAPAGCTLLAWQAPSRHAKPYSRGLQAVSCQRSAPSEVSISTRWGLSSDQKLAGLQFSPCGNLIIVSIRSRNVMSGRTNQLCHVECGLEGDLRELIHVADLISPAVPSASAWHPSQGSLFSMPLPVKTSASISLMDARIAASHPGIWTVMLHKQATKILGGLALLTSPCIGPRMGIPWLCFCRASYGLWHSVESN